MSQPTQPATACGAEMHVDTVQNCNSRLGQRDLSFVLLDELDNPEHQGAYDAVICMEVLEHMIDIGPILDRFETLLAPSGKLLISVPVETGIPLLIKQAARRVAGWRGIGDYPGTSPYSLREYYAGVFAGSRQSIVRPIHRGENDYAVHDHKGFNWMVLREALAQRFRIERILGSPLTWLSPHLASQVWFIASQKSQPRNIK
jgi:SAM-dependent methyltransferase